MGTLLGLLLGASLLLIEVGGLSTRSRCRGLTMNTVGLVGLVGVEERLLEELVYVDAGGRVVDECAFAAAAYESGQPKLREVLTHRRRGGADKLSEAGDGRLAL